MTNISRNLSESYRQSVTTTNLIESKIKNLKLHRVKNHNMLHRLQNYLKDGQHYIGDIDVKKERGKISEAITSIDNEIDELEELRKYVTSYVEVMPHLDKIENPNLLSPDEIYTMITRGYKRDAPGETDYSNVSPPPAKPDLDRRDLHLYRGGDPMSGVIKDRLNASDRFEDLIRQSALSSQEALNDKLDRALDKLGPDILRKLGDRADQLQKRAKIDPGVAQYEQYLNRLGR